MMGFLPSEDERIRATVLAIADDLTEDGLVLRYRVEGTDTGCGATRRSPLLLLARDQGDLRANITSPPAGIEVLLTGLRCGAPAAAAAQMARCAGSPAIATTARTVTLSRSWRAEPQASCSLPKASDTPMSDAAGMVVTEMNTPIRVLDRASVSETTPTTPARAATMKENQFGVLIRSEPGGSPGHRPGLEPRPPDHQCQQQRADHGRVKPITSAAALCRILEKSCRLRERQAEDGAVFRADHHRADDEDLGVGQDPDGSDQPGDDQQCEPARRKGSLELDPRLDLGPDGGELLEPPCRAAARSASAEIEVSTFSSTIEPRWSTPRSRSRPITWLAAPCSTSNCTASPSGL